MNILKDLVAYRHREYEIAINTSFGGFGLTREMCDELKLNYATDAYIFNHDRANPILINLIEKHKPKDLEIIKIELEDIPRAFIRDYDGNESIEYRDDDFSTPLLDFLCVRN